MSNQNLAEILVGHGSLAAISALAINLVGKMNRANLLESEEEYGVFLIRQHTHDNPPYQIDDSIYTRHDQRKSLDVLGLNIQMEDSLVLLDEGHYTRYESAFHNAS